MRIFVDEIPNCCGNCGFCCKDDLGYWCQAERLVYIADELYDKKRLQSCPLKLLADHTKQVRKEVCEEIKQKADIEFERCRCENYITGEDTLIRRKLYRIDEEKLDQIQGETK